MPLRRVHAFCRDDAIETWDRTLRLCSAWLLLVSIGCLALCLLTLPSFEAVEPERAVVLGLGATVVVVSASAAMLAQRRISRRSLWFQRVQAGEEPDWTVLPRRALPELDEPRPLFFSNRDCNAVLVRHQHLEGGGAYRSASSLVPWAMVNLPEGLAELSFTLPSDEDRPNR